MLYVRQNILLFVITNFTSMISCSIKVPACIITECAWLLQNTLDDHIEQFEDGEDISRDL